MSFLSPWLLLGAAAVTIPVVLHFFYKARYRRLPWAAMTFLRLTLPLMMGGVIGGMVLTWVTVASELSSTVVLYSGPWATMTVVMFQALESTGAGIASAAATVLIVVTVLPVAFVYRLLRRYELAMM